MDTNYFTLDFDAERAPSIVTEPKPLKGLFFQTIKQATAYVTKNLNMSISWFWVNQYAGTTESNHSDDERVGTCYLDEAVAGGYEDLSLMP